MRILKEVHWPEILRIDGARAIGAVYDYLGRMRKALALRDQVMARAINAADIEVVDAMPAAAPDFEGVCLRVYDDGAGTRRLYVWVNNAWVYVALT